MRFLLSNRFLLLLVLFCCTTAVTDAQTKFPLTMPVNVDFEGASAFPLLHWVSFGESPNPATLTSKVVKNGNYSLEIESGGSVQSYMELTPNSAYQLSVWVKTESGSDEVQVNILGLGENNISVASALASWTLIERVFHVGDNQNKGTIEFSNPENSGKNKVWVDDLKIERIGDYTPQKPSGIKRFPERKQFVDMGIQTQPNEKLDWLLDARFGMFIHWGLYAGSARGEWFMHNQGMHSEEYRKFAYPQSGDQYFAADKFDAKAWAKLAKDAGMKYMNLTTRHHDGYALFESKHMNAFTSKQTHNRDFVKEYVEACRNHGLRVGLFISLMNWRFPGYYDVTGADAQPNRFGHTTDPSNKENARLMKEELYCQVKELMTNYGKIDQLFWDGGWLAQQGSDADAAYFWESGKFMDPDNQWPVNPYFQDIDQATGKPLGLMGMVRKYQPDIIVNPRSGWYGDYRSEEGGAPVTGPVRTEHVYEKCMSIASAWGYNLSMEDPSRVRTVEQIKRMLADCVIRNMALLLNVGPDRHGEISKPMTDVLLATGRWLEQVGKAVYGTRGGPWNPKDGHYGFAYKGNTIYVYLLSDYPDARFTMPALNKGQNVVRAYMVDSKKAVKYDQNNNHEVVLSGIDRSDKTVSIIAVELNKNVME